MNDASVHPIGRDTSIYQPAATSDESRTVPAEPSDESGTFLTSSEAASLVGVDSRTIRRWFNSGKIRGKLDGHKLLVQAEDIRKMSGTAGATVDFSPGQPSDVSGIEIVDAEMSGTNRDGLIEKLVNQLVGAASRVSWLESELANKREEIKLLPDLQAKAAELDSARTELDSAKAENNTLKLEIESLRGELEAAKKPWWKKVFGSPDV